MDQQTAQMVLDKLGSDAATSLKVVTITTGADSKRSGETLSADAFEKIEDLLRSGQLDVETRLTRCG